jgi:mRNA-degrading endonuclease RelE of RelBE toxin-antitoxin system
MPRINFNSQSSSAKQYQKLDKNSFNFFNHEAKNLKFNRPIPLAIEANKNNKEISKYSIGAPFAMLIPTIKEVTLRNGKIKFQKTYDYV